MDHIILNHGQGTWTTPKLAPPPLLTTTPTRGRFSSRQITVARWVKAFNEGHTNVADMHRPSHLSVSEAEVHAVAALMDSNRRQTIHELARRTELAQTTVWCTC
ncbi:hypothetical protein TNCV_445821 [Trichonephila clavipes]|nr:hypothetical protein TNCV_445821 [Trichonephila clavipes]